MKLQAFICRWEEFQIFSMKGSCYIMIGGVFHFRQYLHNSNKWSFLTKIDTFTLLFLTSHNTSIDYWLIVLCMYYISKQEWCFWASYFLKGCLNKSNKCTTILTRTLNCDTSQLKELLEVYIYVYLGFK